MSSKEEERKALREIEAILKRLGTEEDSYVYKALEGSLDIAAQNIENDFLCSYKESLESERKKSKALSVQIMELEKNMERLQGEYERLLERYEKELEWKPYEEKNVYSQDDYDKLRKWCNDNELSVDEAKDIICEHGFERSQIRIVTEVPVYEINRHNDLRQCGLVDRRPFYDASDLNCIVFECAGYVHELQNGIVRFHNRDFA